MNKVMRNSESKIIAVDFDGTVVQNQFPHTGEFLPGALDTLRELQAAGHRLILWTCRAEEFLIAAAATLQFNGIELWGINENPEQKEWSSSPKIYADVYIDELALGCPIKSYNPQKNERREADWRNIRFRLIQEGYLHE